MSSFESDAGGGAVQTVDMLAELAFAVKEEDKQGAALEAWKKGGRIGEPPEYNNPVVAIKVGFIAQGFSIPEINALTEQAYTIVEAMEDNNG